MGLDEDENIWASLETTPRAPCSISVSNFTVPGTKCLMRIPDCRWLMLENVLTGSTVNSTLSNIYLVTTTIFVIIHILRAHHNL